MLDGYGVEVPNQGSGLGRYVVAALTIILTFAAAALIICGIVVFVTVDSAPRSQITSDLDTTLGYACGYNAGAAMVLQKWTGSYPDKMREPCQKIKETAAANGFTQ